MIEDDYNNGNSGHSINIRPKKMGKIVKEAIRTDKSTKLLNESPSLDSGDTHQVTW